MTSAVFSSHVAMPLTMPISGISAILVTFACSLARSASQILHDPGLGLAPPIMSNEPAATAKISGLRQQMPVSAGFGTSSGRGMRRILEPADFSGSISQTSGISRRVAKIVPLDLRVMFSNHVGWESSWKIVRVLDIFSVLCCEQLLEGLARSACRIF